MERNNGILQEIARSMLSENNSLNYFRAKEVKKFCYILSHVLVKIILKGTPIELCFNKLSNIVHFEFLIANSLF